jgi:hypothetical protein
MTTIDVKTAAQEFLSAKISDEDLRESCNKVRSMNLRKFLVIHRRIGYEKDPDKIVKELVKLKVCSKRTAYDYAHALIFVSQYHYANMQIHVQCGAKFKYPFWVDWVHYGGPIPHKDVVI